MSTGRPLTPEDLWDLRRVGAPAPAPDASFVVLPVAERRPDADKATGVLYRVPTGGGSPTRLTSPEHASSSPAVSPDGTLLALVRKSAGSDHGQLAVLPLGGGEAEILTDLPLGVTEARWLPDGTGLVLLAPLLREAPDVEGTRQLLEARADRRVKAIVTEDRIYRFWDRWLEGGEIHHLFRYDLGSRKLTDLTPGSTRWFDLMDPSGSWDVSPDGNEVAFSANATEAPYDSLNYLVFVTPADGSGHPAPLSGEVPGHQLAPRYDPNGRWLAYGVKVLPDFYADRVRLALFDRAAGTETALTEDWDRSPLEWEFTAAGDRIVLTADDRARASLFTMPLEAAEPEMLVEGGWCAHPRPATDGTVHFTTASLRAPAEPHRVDVNGGPPERIASFNGDLMGGLELGEVEEIEVPGAGGVPAQAFVVSPPGHDPSRPAPLVQMIHGGPHGVFGDTWHYRWNAQVLAAAGYVVALVNFHGSSSFGQDYLESIHGAWGDKPSADVLAVTDHLVDEGVADPERMAIIGGSYGGYLVAWLTTVTDRFAAAVVHAGVTNLLGQWASDVTRGRERSVGSVPWEDVDRIQQWSPTNHMTDVVTPTLVIHGEKDYRVVVTQGLELYGILKAKGVEARLVYYPDENHWILKRSNSLHWYGEVLGWLDRYLGDGPD